MRRIGFLTVLSAWLLCALGASAQWPTSPYERLYVGNGIENAIISDGEGGASSRCENIVGKTTTTSWASSATITKGTTSTGM